MRTRILLLAAHGLILSAMGLHTPASPSSPTGLRLSIESVQGNGEELKTRFRWRGLEGGIRLRYGEYATFLGSRLWGGKVQLFAGGFKVVYGKGIALGYGGRFFYARGTVSAKRPLFTVRPSLSFWNCPRGFLFTAETLPFRVSAGVFETLHGKEEPSPPALLFALALSRSGLEGSLLHLRSLHWRIPSGEERKGGASWGISFNLSRSGMRLSGETELVGRRIFALLDLFTPMPFALSARCFVLPPLSSLGDWSRIRVETGAGFEGFLLFLGGSRGRSPSVVLGWTMSSSPSEVQRESILEVGTGRRIVGDLTWRASLEIDQRERRWREGTPLLRMEEGAREWEVRSKWFLSARRGVLRPRLFVDAALQGIASGPSVIMGADLSYRMGPISLLWGMRTYSLRSGATRVVFRKGIGSFERFRFVRGEGTDLSILAEISTADGGKLMLYYGIPGSRDPRLYVGFSYAH